MLVSVRVCSSSGTTWTEPSFRLCQSWGVLEDSGFGHDFRLFVAWRCAGSPTDGRCNRNLGRSATRRQYPPDYTVVVVQTKRVGEACSINKRYSAP
jgi:hypothetical protein